MPAPGAEHLRVALLSPCYWPEVRRGTERFVRELADGLLAQGQQPALITSHPGPPRRSLEAGLPVTRLPRPPQGLLLRRNFDPYLTHAPLSYLALRRGAFDLAHAVYPTDALAGARWSARTDRPSVLSYMGIPNLYWLQAARLRLRILRRALEECDAVVALSRHAAGAFERSFGRSVVTIPPGVDLNAFQPRAARAAELTIVCSAAPEVPRKNVALLVEAFALIRERYPDARLVLSRPRSWEAVRRVGIDPRAAGLEWRNLDDREALSRAYSEAWAAVLPAVEEAFGLVLIEALACGTPAVGLASAGIPEVIDGDGIGRLFEGRDPQVLARSLLEVCELSQDPETSGRCRARAAEFSIERCTKRYLALYRELIAGSRVNRASRGL